jgi:acyl-CoA synthetase (AMP-forming)/AMP-acid ligase II
MPHSQTLSQPTKAPRDDLAHSGLLRSFGEHDTRTALVVDADEPSLTYGEFGRRVFALASVLQAEGRPGDFVAVFAYRTTAAYVAIAGALLAGKGYVPLNRTFPPERTSEMLRRAHSTVIVADGQSARQLPDVLRDAPDQHFVVLLDGDPRPLRVALPGHDVLGPADLVSSRSWRMPERSPDALAYLLVTSGSTGAP